MTNLLLILFLFFQLPSHHNNDSSLLESGKAATIKPTNTTPAEVKIVSYNIRWRSSVSRLAMGVLRGKR